MSDYASSDIQCPFHREFDRQRKKIRCEGLEDHSNIELGYQKREAFHRQLTVFCCEKYVNCEIYHAIIEAKYQGE